MGKAGKWIRNYLMGKKEEKHKKIDASIDNNTANMASQMKVPKVKRRWSFGRKRGKVEAHKVSRSFNSSDSAKQQIQAIVETETPKNSPRDNENVAATKIQSAFRSYLARKALHALRGLVKIQALVRGHLVRKQTSATLRGMHALMTIQVRARIQRIHMAEEAKLHVGKQSWQHREIPHNRGLVREYKDSKDMSIRDMLGVLKSRSSPLDHLLVKSTEHDSMAFPFYSRHFSVSKRGRRDKENALITAPNSPEHYQIKALSTSQRHSVSNDHLLAPNYMTNTQSSRAKTRSQSEPKERPKRGTRQKNKPMESRNELSTSLDGRRQYLSLNSSPYNHGSLDHWIIKDTKFDSFSSSTPFPTIPVAHQRPIDARRKTGNSSSQVLPNVARKEIF